MAGWRCPDSYALITLCVMPARAASSAWDSPDCFRAWRSRAPAGLSESTPLPSGSSIFYAARPLIRSCLAVSQPLGLTASRRPQSKIKLSGRLSGKSRLREPIWCLRALACARVLAGQAFCLGLQNLPVIHGKEKVYGSIP